MRWRSLLAGLILLSPLPAFAQTWTYLGLGGHVVYAIKSVGPWLYAGTDDGVYRKDRASADTLWTHLSFSGLEIYDLQFVNDSTVVAAVLDSVSLDRSFLYRSTDEALTWTLVLNPANAYLGDLDSHPDFPSTIYAMDGYNGPFKSTDGGETWTDLSAPFISWSRIRVATADPAHVFAGGSGLFFEARLYESLDAGATWTQVTSLGSPGGDNAVLGIETDPDTAARIYLGMLYNTARSVDDGASWSYQFLSPSCGYVEDIAVDPGEHSRLFGIRNRFDCGGTVLHLIMSEDQGLTWTTLAHNPGYGEGEGHDLELIPVPGGTNVYFAGRGVYRVGVFEGRAVRRFETATRDAGAYEVVWSGDDDRGRPVARGTYFLKLSASGSSLTGRITWLGRSR